jgi:hypothetical protein
MKPSADSPDRPRGALLVSIAFHSGVVAIALGWVVSRYFEKEEEIAFVAQPRVQLPAQIREHQMNVAKNDSMAPRPTYSRRLAGTGPSTIQVPEMPDVNLDQMLPLDPSEMVSDQIAGLIGSSGQGTGTGRGFSGGGGTGTGSGVAFFDIRDNAKSVVIMIDVSQSMFSRTGDYDSGARKLLKEGKDQSFQVVRDEAIKLIDGLGANSRFGIIRWSGSARSWKPELVRATDANKAEARAHVQESVDANSAPPTGGRPGGTRHDYAIEELLRLNPEVAFMLTDGNATRTGGGGGMSTIPNNEIFEQLEAAAKELPALPRIHTVYYMTGADKKEEEDLLRGIARKTKAKFRKVEAAGLKEREAEKEREKRKR